MKGILGRKVGMTQLFSDQGKLIPVTVIEVKPNVVTKVLTQEKNGYVALQLGVEDKKTSRSNKPELGHAKKANTTPKRFTKEIRGMEGHQLGDVLYATIFTPGELVDVQGTSKGHGFSGTIKRHNQSIGPKSHGGGGGSQPQRQTGSLGDISGNKVVKGMTMPGQYGNVTSTIQNLEVVSVDVENHLLLVKGSIPGPKKSFVVVKEAVKGLPTREAIELVDVNIAIRKNELLEEAKKAGADVNTEMSIKDMQAAISAAQEAKDAAEKAAAAKVEAEKAEAEAKKAQAQADKAKEQLEGASTQEEKAKAEAKVEQAEKAAEAATEQAAEVKAEAQEEKAQAKEAAAKAEELQVETEDEVVEEESKDETKGGA